MRSVLPEEEVALRDIRAPRELPRIEGITTVVRAVLAEMISELVPSVAAIREIVIDSAANQATRDALIATHTSTTGAQLILREGADPGTTPLGHLMRELAREVAIRAKYVELTNDPRFTIEFTEAMMLP